MRPLIIHTRHFPPRRFHAITLFPFIFFNDSRITEQDIRHETVHMWQQVALLVLPFYLLYFLFWIVNLARYRDSMQAYYAIPFERSAYRLEKESHASKCTMAFDWLKCIFPSKSSRN